MIDSNKLLGNETSEQKTDNIKTTKNIVVIKKSLIKIDSLLKERLVLSKIRQGILMEQEENNMRRQREDDLENKGRKVSSKQKNDKCPEKTKFIRGIIAAMTGLTALFLPQLIKLLNFLRRILSPVTKMITSTLKALTSFLTVGKDMKDQVEKKYDFTSLTPINIQTSFDNFSSALSTFVYTLIAAGTLQTLQSLDINGIKNFVKRIRKGENIFSKTKVTKGVKIPVDDKFLLDPTLDFIQKQKKTFSIPITDRRFRVNPKGRKINPEDGRFFAKRTNKQRLRKLKEEEILERAIRIQQQSDFEFEEFLKTTPQGRKELRYLNFLRDNELPDPKLLRRQVADFRQAEGVNLYKQLQSGKISEKQYDNLLEALDVRVSRFLGEINQYDTEIIRATKGKLSVGELKVNTFGEKSKFNIFKETKNKGLIKPERAILKPVVNPLKKVMGDTSKSVVGGGNNNILNSFKEAPFFDPMNPRASVIGGGFSDSFFNKSVTKPSGFRQGINFLEGIDQTMVEFSTKKGEKVLDVITSGPLKGLTKGAKGMFRRAVEESIGLVPFLGDLVGLLLDIYLFGEIPERAGYKAVGGILGGFVGALIGSFPPLIPFGGPLIGSIIGGIGGDILGGFVYDMVKGQEKKVSTPVKPVKEAVKKAFKLGGFTGKGDPNKIAGLVHKGEFVLDEDTTLAVRQNAPGFLDDLNKAEGFESLNILRNYASYEGSENQFNSFVPIPIPIRSAAASGSTPLISLNNNMNSDNKVKSSHYDR